MNRGKITIPLAMRSNVDHNQVLHEHVVVLSITTLLVPFVPDADRVSVDDLGHTDDGITHVGAGVGYLEAGDRPGLARWRKNLFVATSLITADAARYFNLPRDRTIIMGSRITI